MPSISIFETCCSIAEELKTTRVLPQNDAVAEMPKRFGEPLNLIRVMPAIGRKIRT